MSKRPFYLLFNLLFFLPLKAQKTDHLRKLNDTVALDQRFYLQPSELQTMLGHLKNAPVLNRDCINVQCEKIKSYHTTLYNLQTDIHLYYDALHASAAVSRNQWLLYLDQTYKNETLKWGLITNLRFRDAWTNFSSSVLDLASLMNAFQSASGLQSKETISQMTALTNVLDGVLASLNIIVKTLTVDGSKSAIGELSSDEWNAIYSGLKSNLELVNESIALYKNVDGLVGTTLDEIGKLKRLRKANIAAAVVQLVNLYVSYDNKLMKQHIDELDKVLSPNQKVQSQHYQTYKAKLSLLDLLSQVSALVKNREEGVYHLNLDCGGTLKRNPRTKTQIDADTFGAALKYYSEVLRTTTKTLPNTWEGIKPCELAKPPSYTFRINDGIGKEIKSLFSIFSEKNAKLNMQGGIPQEDGKFNLFPGTYIIDIKESSTVDNVFLARTFVENIKISGQENTEITINPYGRVELELVTKEGQPLNFAYKFTDKNGTQIAKGTRFDKILLDLPSGTPIGLNLDHGLKGIAENAIILEAGKILKLRYVYDEGKFVREEAQSQFNGSNASTAENTTMPENQVPLGWAKGTLYNSNDGNCKDLRGKYLEFTIRGQKILDLNTGTYIERAVVAPGDKLWIAAPESGGHFRVNILNVNQDTNGQGNQISFWFADHLIDGWWFSSGCKNGTRPSVNCNDGIADQGDKSYSECRTLGEN